MIRVDLNSDLGESFGVYKLGMDQEVLAVITSANIACGMHAGDPLVMTDTVKSAAANKTAIGAHPGYPDLSGFGRRNLVMSPEEIKAYVIYQIGALAAFAKVYGQEIQHVKAHGALYNMAAKDYRTAYAIAEAVKAVDPEMIFMALANSELVKAARDIGLKVAEEVFADRAYNPDGTLVARGTPGAMVHDKDQAVSRTVRMVTEGKVTAVNGEEINIKADSICVHGDNPYAIAFVKEIRNALKKAQVSIEPLANFLR
ncbi:MAG: LamB/YcsF family protein [Peptococcaceae bacterium]